MRKKILIAATALCISCSALASSNTDVLCPTTVTCSQTSQGYVCKANGSSAVSWQFDQSRSNHPDTGYPIRFAAAWYQNGKVSCQYAANPGPGPSGYAVMHANSGSLKPDTRATGSRWYKGFCSQNYAAYQPEQCPFQLS